VTTHRARLVCRPDKNRRSALSHGISEKNAQKTKHQTQVQKKVGLRQPRQEGLVWEQLKQEIQHNQAYSDEDWETWQTGHKLAQAPQESKDHVSLQ
jgi:hypothetical protein